MKTLPASITRAIDNLYYSSRRSCAQSPSEIKGLFFIKVNIAANNIIPKIQIREYLSTLDKADSGTIVVPAILSGLCKASSSSDLIKKSLIINNYKDSAYTRFYIGYQNYYALPGVIFDDEKVPLMALAEEIDEVKLKEEITFKRPACLINPKVFSKTDKVSKYIVQTVIPAISNHLVLNPHRYVNERRRYKETDIVKVVIDGSIEDFFYKPAVPTTLYPDEEIYNILTENIEEVLDDIG